MTQRAVLSPTPGKLGQIFFKGVGVHRPKRPRRQRPEVVGYPAKHQLDLPRLDAAQPGIVNDSLDLAQWSVPH